MVAGYSCAAPQYIRYFRERRRKVCGGSVRRTLQKREIERPASCKPCMHLAGTPDFLPPLMEIDILWSINMAGTSPIQSSNSQLGLQDTNFTTAPPASSPSSQLPKVNPESSKLQQNLPGEKNKSSALQKKLKLGDSSEQKKLPTIEEMRHVRANAPYQYKGPLDTLFKEFSDTSENTIDSPAFWTELGAHVAQKRSGYTAPSALFERLMYFIDDKANKSPACQEVAKEALLPRLRQIYLDVPQEKGRRQKICRHSRPASPKSLASSQLSLPSRHSPNMSAAVGRQTAIGLRIMSRQE